jgi:hypothetical protein
MGKAGERVCGVCGIRGARRRRGVGCRGVTRAKAL